MNRTSLLGVFVLLVLAGTQLHASDGDVFFKRYCYGCHDNDVEEAGFSIESLKRDYLSRDTHQAWVRVHDRIGNGDMPPRDEEQPTGEERSRLLAWLSDKLHAASLERQKAGRVTIRRMNRVEYEYTMQDLLGVGVRLKETLPEDNKVAGFDTISAGLETSATHLVRYQEAADKALQALYPARVLGPDQQRLWKDLGTDPGEQRSNDRRGGVPTRDRWTGREYFDSRPAPNKKGVIDFIRFEGDSLIQCAQLYKHGSMATRRTVVPGLYRVRASMRAVNTEGGKSLQVEIGRMSTDRFGHEKLEHLLGIRDVHPGDGPGGSQVIEVAGFLKANEQVYVSARNLTMFNKMKSEEGWKPVGDDYKGPGLAIDWIEFEGPIVATDGYREFFGNVPRTPDRFYEDTVAGKKVSDWTRMHPNEFLKPHHRLRLLSSSPKEDAERWVRRFARRAFRGTQSPGLIEAQVSRVHDLLDKGVTLDQALLTVYKEILCSPLFLFRIEEPGELDDFALASRLSYFLWSSMPDVELLEVAAKGELRKPDVLRAQTERMLADWRADRFVRRFTGQWLELDKLLDMKPDKIYVEYDEDLAWSMGEETRRFFEHVLDENRPVTEFVHSDWTMLNQRLAQHYGIPGIQGMDLRRVKLPANAHRGGIITHASILKLTTNATYTSPIKRGAWLLDRIMGTPPASPPPAVEAIEPDIRGAVTIREQMALHKKQPVCASCHRKIDPPGFALENFDVVGGWRERYRVATGNSQPGDKKEYVELANYPGKKVWMARPVEAFGESADGSKFANIDDYKLILLRDKDQIARNLARKLLIYGSGATLQFADRRAVESIVRQAKADNYGLRTLLHAVVQSRVFRTK